MKIIAFCLLVVVSMPINAARKMSDRVLVNLHHPEGRVLILQSDLRPDLMGNVPSVEDLLLKELVLLDARKIKMPISEADVDRHIARVQEQLKMTRDDLVAFFKERGFSFDEAKKELEKSLIVEMTVEHRVKNKAYVSKSELEKYHKDHPLEFYEIRQAFVPYGLGSKTIQRALIDQEIANGAILKSAQWQDAITLKDADFSPEKAFVKALQPGTIVCVQEMEDGVALLQLVSKKIVSFEERKQELTMELSKDRHRNALNEYYDKLLKDAQPYTRMVAVANAA